MPITISEVGRKYPGGIVALESVSLVIPDGQFVSLIGPSGCGKSTLLAMLAGLDAPTTGRVAVSGRVGMVFQEPALFPWRSVRDNVSFGLQMRGVGKRERESRADDALKMVHLSRFAGAYPHELSGGMRQRAAIARALVADPEVLLMDEPFGALDAQTRSLLQSELLSVWETTRKTVVFVTHGMDEALTLSDRIVLLSARPGRIIADIVIDAPHPRDPQTDPTLRAAYEMLRDLLTKEVESVARAEHDGDWEGVGKRTMEPEASVGADI
ncbi:MAG: ABC transporter ATP-binding protein [Akkermansiaceae bacterium]|nr:ABC transporter ATP-binding protein [Armatimonadota bacterium]